MTSNRTIYNLIFPSRSHERMYLGLLSVYLQAILNRSVGKTTLREQKNKSSFKDAHVY